MEHSYKNNECNHEIAPYKHCLNCGSELQGMYCHKCGQYASNPTPKVWEFVLEYLNNAFVWDSKFFSTLWNLIRRPGFLTNEFNAGRFVAYEHPLKLNMFFLFIFVTLFFLFSNTEKADDSINDLTKNELVLPHLVLQALSEDSVYAQKMQIAERDTITLLAPLQIVKDFPHHVTSVRVVSDSKGIRIDTLVAAIPDVLIEDSILVGDKINGYQFSEKNHLLVQEAGLNDLNIVWRKILDLLGKYFPLIVLMTAPFLAFAVKILYWKRKKPLIHSFIFSLHYIAFLEFLLLLIYLMYLTVQPSYHFLEGLMAVSSCLYLTLSLKKVYVDKSWLVSIGKSLLISLIYIWICFCAFLAIFIVAVFIVVSQDDSLFV